MSVLEDRYRAVLRVLPASYRAVWGEEMVSTFLDSTRTGDPEDDEFLADFGRPSMSEVVSVVVLAVRVRLAGPAVAPRIAVGGQAVRVVAMVGLLVNAIALPAAVVQHWWLSTGMPLPAANRAAINAHPADTAAAIDVFGVLWIAALVAVLVGQYRAGKLLAVVALVPSAARAIEMTVHRSDVPDSLVIAVWCDLLVYVLLVAALAAFNERVSPPRRRPWLIALAVVVLGVGPVVGVLPILQPVDQPGLDWPGLVCVVWLVAALVPRVTRSLTSATAVALLAVPVLALRLVWLLYDTGLGGVGDYPPLLVGLVELAVVAAASVLLLLRTGHRVRSEAAAAPRPSVRS